MTVKEAMTDLRLAIGPSHSLREAAQKMRQQSVGAAIIIDPDAAGFAILSERDVLMSVAAGHDLDKELVSDHMNDNIISASPEWDLNQAAQAMLRHNFRHLLVVDGGDICGVISMRDIVKAWHRK